jgi:uncharacterized RDD family membrane protein YckC
MSICLNDGMSDGAGTGWSEANGGEVITGEAVALDLRSVGFVLRATGAIIDWLIYFGSYIIFVIVLTSVANQVALGQALTTALSVVGLVLCVVVVPMTVELLSHGKSVGKLVVGARIVRDDGGAIGFRHAFIRALVGVFETFITFGGLAAIVALLNGRAQRLGDLVAGTYSQNERVRTRPLSRFAVPDPLRSWAELADVARLPDPLARRVSSFLVQAQALTPVTRTGLARSLANEVRPFVSPVPAGDPELFLAGVAAVRHDRELAAQQGEQARLTALAPVLNGLPRGFPDRG